MRQLKQFKTCRRCGELKPTKQFHRNGKPRQPGCIQAFKPYCKPCRELLRKETEAKDPLRYARYRSEQYKKQRARIRARDSHRQHTWAVRDRYGLKDGEYERLLEEQGGVCAICGKPPRKERLAVDHDHVTKRVRGLLHRRCNAAIGMLHDDPRLLRAALAYLERRIMWQIALPLRSA